MPNQWRWLYWRFCGYAYPRFLYFDLPAGNSILKFWYTNAQLETTINLYVTDGTNVIGTSSAVGNYDFPTQVIYKVNYTGTASTNRLYLYSNHNINFYRINVNVPVNTLATDSVTNNREAKIYTEGHQVFLSNISAETQVKVYSMTGNLLKSFSTNKDTNFLLNTGNYLVTLKTNQKEKTSKILVR